MAEVPGLQDANRDRAYWPSRVASRRDRVELAGLIVLNRLHDLVTRVHDERPVRDDGSADRLGVTEQQHGIGHGFDLDGVAGIVELYQVPLGRFAARDLDRAAHDVEEHAAAGDAGKLDARAGPKL